MVDVRDVAKVLLDMIKNSNAANRRYILSASSMKTHEILKPVIDKYRPKGWQITN